MAPPCWRFGHGLSYTTFALSALAPKVASEAGLRADWQDQGLVVKVTNTGDVPGDCVVICFVSVVLPTTTTLDVSPPIRSLFDFGRANDIKPGESRELRFMLTARARSLVDRTGAIHFLPDGQTRVSCQATGGATAGVDIGASATF